jgi:hypothetical protein
MTTRIVASNKIILLIIIIRKGFNVSSREKNCIYTTVEKSLMAFAPCIPRRASGSNLGALAIIMDFSTLVYNCIIYYFNILVSLSSYIICIVFQCNKIGFFYTYIYILKYFSFFVSSFLLY